MSRTAIRPALLLAAALSLPAFAQTAAAPAATTPVAGATVLGVTQTVAAEVAEGWSAKHNIIGKVVYNDAAKSERVGKIADIIINPKGSVSFAVVNAGGFLGLAKHDVLVPVEQFRIEGNRITLPGATKEALRAAPDFTYARGGARIAR